MKNPKIYIIDAETWAESGRTGGIFGNLFRAGRLHIAEYTGNKIVPNIKKGQKYK